MLALPDGNLAIGMMGIIKIINPLTGDVVQTLIGHTREVSSLATLPNGNLASSSDGDLSNDGSHSFLHIIRIWNLAGGVEVKNFILNDAVLSMVSLGNDRLVVSLKDKSIKILNIVDGKPTGILKGHSDLVQSMVVLSNGDLVTGSDDRTIRVWNVNTFRYKRTLLGHSGYIRSLALLPNDELVSGSWDGLIKIWDTNTGRNKKVLRDRRSPVISLAVMSNGDLVSVCSDDRIKIWNMSNGTIKMSLRDRDNQYSELTKLQYLKNGFLASSIGKKIKIWHL